MSVWVVYVPGQPGIEGVFTTEEVAIVHARRIADALVERTRVQDAPGDPPPVTIETR